MQERSCANTGQRPARWFSTQSWLYFDPTRRGSPHLQGDVRTGCADIMGRGGFGPFLPVHRACQLAGWCARKCTQCHVNGHNARIAKCLVPWRGFLLALPAEVLVLILSLACLPYTPLSHVEYKQVIPIIAFFVSQVVVKVLRILSLPGPLLAAS